MKSRSRSILALTLLLTTLCAGRLFAADAGSRSTAAVMTDRLVARLTKSFGRTVSHRPVLAERRLSSPIAQPVFSISTDRSLCIALTPCQFRLPPPLV